MLRFRFRYGLLLLAYALTTAEIAAQPAAPYIRVIDSLDLEQTPPGTLQRYWLHLADNALSQPVYVPVFVARGAAPGPVLGLAAAIHGDELNGIPIIQQVFREIDPARLRGVLVGIPGVNAVSLPLEQRRFPDDEDLNRVFPGSPTGSNSDQYVYRLFQRLIRPMDMLIDMHTASFGRVNALYVRADLRSDTLAGLARRLGAEIVVDSRGPSVGQSAAAGRTLRGEAALAGIHTLTVEYGNPQVYQPEMIERGVRGVKNSLAWLGMTDDAVDNPAEPVYCARSYWLYTDAGGLLEVLPRLNQRLARDACSLRSRYSAPAGALMLARCARDAGSGQPLLQPTWHAALTELRAACQLG
jgi:uncharacterized protein